MSDKVCPRCGGPLGDCKGYCRTCRAAYMRDWRRVRREVERARNRRLAQLEAELVSRATSERRVR